MTPSKGEIMTSKEMIETGKQKRASSAIYKVKSMEATDEAIKQTVIKALKEIELSDINRRIDLSDIEMLKTITKAYIATCADTSSFPSMSGLARALGTSRQALYWWIHNKPTTETAKWLVTCHDTFSDIIAETALRNNCNPVYAIFIQKAMFGLRDNTPEYQSNQDEIMNDERQSELNEIYLKRYGSLIDE